MDYRKMTMAFFKAWVMSFGVVMAIYAAFMAVWFKCKRFRKWLTSKFVAASLEVVEDYSFNEELKAI